MTRSEKIIATTITGLGMEIVSFISGLILPKLILENYGSEVNGLITSITQFLAYLTLLESGIGGVVKAALYKPLDNKDIKSISSVVKATEVFFRKLAGITVIYLIILCLIYPMIVKSNFDKIYVIFMILIIGMTILAQYYFGITYQLVLQADQKTYLYNSIQIIIIIMNLTISAILIVSGASVHLFKFFSGIVFILRPISIFLYCKKKYCIIDKVKPNEDAIKQRWYGVGFSIASFVHKKTDIFVLSIFSSLINVSIYAVYSIVLTGINSLISNVTGSFQAAFGNMIARKEIDNIKRNFGIYLFISNLLVTIVFSVTLLQIVPFVQLYTSKIYNVIYIQPTFALIITLAEMIFCLRQPYQAIITAAGHYKQTNIGAYIEAIINIMVSLILIQSFSLIGIAIGTLLSMIYRTIDYTLYLRKNIINYSLFSFIKRIITVFSIVCIMYITSKIIIMNNSTWLHWCVSSIIYMLISTLFSIIINSIFFYNDLKNTIIEMINITKKRINK